MLMGNDFSLTSAHRMFASLDRATGYFNSNSTFDFNLRYSTLSEYFEEVVQEM